jgi:hypothetical protein
MIWKADLPGLAAWLAVERRRLERGVLLLRALAKSDQRKQSRSQRARLPRRKAASALSLRIRRSCAIGLILLALGLLIGVQQAVRTDQGPPTAEELRQAIAVRDSAIAALRKRVDTLEENAPRTALLPVGSLTSFAASLAKPHRTEPAAVPAPSKAVLAAATVLASPEELEQPNAPARVPLTGRDYAAITGGAVDAEAGPQEEQQEGSDAALRALERTLVEEGGLLLPEWAVEVSSEIEYTYNNSGSVLLVPGFGAVDQDVRGDTIENSGTLRIGLPWAAQADLRVPYIFNQEKVSTAGLDDKESLGSGLGDIEIGLTKQLLWESDLAPDLLGAVRWRLPTGNSAFEMDDDEVATGSGFHAISGHLTAVKSREPLVFFGSLSYTSNLPDSKSGVDIDPGDTIGLSLGSILAAGPGTSLRSSLELNFSRETEVDGRAVPSSDVVGTVLELGAAVVLPFSESKSLLSVTAGVGVTDDAPDFQVAVSLPYRF